MSEDAAGLASKVLARSITADVLLGVFWVTLNRDRSKRVVAHDGTGAATQGTVAAGRLRWRARKRQSNGPTMAGPF